MSVGTVCTSGCNPEQPKADHEQYDGKNAHNRLPTPSFIHNCIALDLLKSSADDDPADLSTEAFKRRMERKFRDNAAKPLFSGTAVCDFLCF